MADVRVSRANIEVLLTGADVRVSRANVEILATADDVRVSRANAEVLFTAQDTPIVSMATVETLGALDDNPRVSSVFVETLIGFVAGFADVVVYTQDAAHSVATNFADWITSSLGWDVTLRDDANLATDSDIADFDGLIYFRGDSAVSTDARAKAETAGVPFALFGGLEWGYAEGTGKTPPPYDSDLTGTWEFVDNSPGVTQINIVDTDHPITSSFSTGLLTVSTTADYSGAVDDGESVVGDVLAEADSNHANYVAGQATLIAVEAGTDDLQGTPVATTQRALIWGAPYNVQYITDDGTTLLQNAFQWLLGSRPNRPEILSANAGPTSVTLTSSIFEHTYVERTHSASRWQVTTAADTTFASVVWDSNYTTDLTSVTTPVATLDYDTSYIARVLYRDDLGQDSEWSASYGFTTEDLVAAGGAVVEFYTSGNSLISSVNTTIEDTDWVDVTLEDIEIPANTAYIRVSPYKDGSGLKKGYTRRMQVDLGSFASGYHPFAFRPEVHTDETIQSLHADAADASVSVDVDWSAARIQTKVLDQASTALTFSNTNPGRYVLILTQDGTGSRTVTWPTAVKWAGGTAPTLSTGASTSDVIGLDVVSGSLIIGHVLALNVS